MSIVIKPYKAIKKSNVSDGDLRRLVMIIKYGDVNDGVAIMKSLRYSINKNISNNKLKA